MMITDKTKKTLGILFVLSVATVIPFSKIPFSNLIPKANAQSIVNTGSGFSTGTGVGTGGTFNTGSGTNTGGTGTNSGSSASGYLKTVGPLAEDLPGCMSEIGTGIKNLFSQQSDGDTSDWDTSDWDTSYNDDPSVSNDEDTSDWDTSYNDDPSTGANSIGPVDTSGDTSGGGYDASALNDNDLSDVSSDASSEVQSVPTNDAALNAKVDKLVTKTNTILGNTNTIQKSTTAVDKNQNCLNAVGKSIVKLVIQKMTLSIVNWIQTGNGGGPMFVQDPGKFFGDIAKDQILGFGQEINDPTKYPFAKDFMQGVANSFNNTFANNAQYSLDKMIKQTNPGSSALTFNSDFSQGGWGAWEAMTQVPANNPLGFQLMASNELGNRIAGTSESPAQVVKDQLQQANGFLSQTICSDPYGVTKEQDQKARAGESASQAFIDANGHVLTPEECTGGWETQTPGTVIGHELTKSMDNSDNSLLSADTLNDAIAAIADASIQKFASELTNKGLASMDTNSDDYGYNATPTPTQTPQTQSDYSASQIASSTWLQQNPNFDIRTGLNQALIDQQRTYVDKLEAEDDALNNDIKWIYQLDYCIPGPNPDWENTAENNIAALANESSPVAKTSWLDSSFANIANKFLDPAGIFSGIKGSLTGSSSASDIGKAYQGLLQGLFNVNIDPSQQLVMDMGGVENLANNVFNSYQSVINQVYFTPGINAYGVDTSLYMPPVTAESRSEFEKVAGYKQLVANNVSQNIPQIEGVITQLEGIKNAVDTLNNQLAAGTITDANGNIAPATDVTDANGNVTTPGQETQYETNLAPYIDSFGRLSSELVSGDDIATVDNLAEQASDEADYVKNDLLLEPVDGCEPFLANLLATNQAAYGTYVGREAYPFPIDHLYGPVESVDPLYGPGHGIYNIPWSQSAVEGMTSVNPGSYSNEGFLYGSAYWNNDSDITTQALAYPNGQGGIDPPGSGLFPAECEQRWIRSVDFSVTNAPNATTNADINGLKAGNPNLSNTCGVVLTFERNLGIY